MNGRSSNRGLLIGACIFMVACASGHCRKPTPLPTGAPSDAAVPEGSEHIFIFKADGSLQCRKGQSIPLEEMKRQLGDIEVYSQARKKDGLMHAQTCGKPTGFSNVYEIPAKDYPAAEKLGFKKWFF